MNWSTRVFILKVFYHYISSFNLSIPEDEAIAQKWRQILGYNDHHSSRLNGKVCIHHFETTSLQICPSGTRLKPGALPLVQSQDESLEHAELDLPVARTHSEEQRENKTNDRSNGKTVAQQAAQIQVLNTRIQQLEAELAQHKHEIFKLSRKLQYTQNAKERLKNEFEKLKQDNSIFRQAYEKIGRIEQDEVFKCLLNGIKPKEKYPPSVREFAMTLYYQSPAAYRTIREKFQNHLPHPKTIATWYQNSDINGKAGLTTESLDRLKKIVADREGEPLVCSLIFDEMFIRKQVYWANDTKTYEGFVNYGIEAMEDDGTDELPKATQAIVFMLSGLNTYFQFPLAYYFIMGLDGKKRANLLTEIISKVTECGVTISNLTFDGCGANFRMCKLMGADLTVGSTEFCPFIKNPLDGSKINIILDPPHMEKLIRNTLASKGVIFDDQDKKIEWRFFVELEKLSQSVDFFTHNLSKRHIQWERNKMNVKIAVQTFSRKVADSMELLLKQKHPKFIDAGPTIRFIRKINDVFDTLNSMKSRKDQIFKRPLNVENERVVFDLHTDATKYFKSLKLQEENPKTGSFRKKRIIDSRRCTGLVGFIITMASMKSIYFEYVKEKKLMKELVAYDFSQDHVELFFAKIRSANGHNSNPNGMQFSSAYRKLLSNIKILAPESSNCKNFGTKLASFSPHTNVYFVSSRRPKLNISNDPNFQKDIQNQEESLFEAYFTLNQMESNEHLSDELYTSSIAYISSIIEEKIKNAAGFYCNDCKFVLCENEKIDSFAVGSNRSNPCRSTFLICKTVDRFLKLYQPGKKTSFNFNVIYYYIFKEIDFNKMYTNSNFEHEIEHKHHFIKCVVDLYIQFKTNQIAHRSTLQDYPIIIRNQLTRMIHFYGQ